MGRKTNEQIEAEIRDKIQRESSPLYQVPTVALICDGFEARIVPTGWISVYFKKTSV